jgi:REP element-mobilizing transposase RayT
MKEYFGELEIPFHIYNRGTEKRIIFTEYAEYCRFVFLMWVCRIGSPGMNLTRKNIIAVAEAILNGIEPDQKFYIKEYEPSVAFVTWNLLPNHFHFILVPLVEGGISKYMGKLANAYTKYFNARHQRNGRLFQGSYQSIAVKDPKYFYTLIRYINLNHAELVEPEWKEHSIRDRIKLEKFVNSYIWSSHLDFLGARHPFLLDKTIISKLLEVDFNEYGMAGYSEFINTWFEEEFNCIKKYIIEK